MAKIKRESLTANRTVLRGYKSIRLKSRPATPKMTKTLTCTYIFNKRYTTKVVSQEEYRYLNRTYGAIMNVMRYEDKYERLERLAARWDTEIDTLVGKTYRIYDLMPESNLVTTFLSTLAAAQALKEAGESTLTDDRRTVLALEKFNAKYPNAKAYVSQGISSIIVGSDATLSNTMHLAPLVVEGVGIKGKALLLKGETPFGNSDSAVDAFLFVPDDGANTLATVMDFVESILDIESEISHIIREIKVWGQNNPIPLPEQSWSTWDEVFLPEEILKQVRDDLLFFMKSEDVFKKVGLPYKRGYLLTGPPGNGKTTICRTIATSMPFAAYSFDFSDQDMGNSDLTEAFRAAKDNAPAVFFLEDIDRIYDPDDKKNRSNVTLDHLLNCLDGIATNNGVVVVATANNPQNLDPAILSRPGRFDRVVQIPDPDHDLRVRYLSYLFRHTDVQKSDIVYAADETEGLSMAFLKEVFILSASRSAIYGEPVARKHIEEALESILAQYGGISKKGNRKAGFGA